MLGARQQKLKDLIEKVSGVLLQAVSKGHADQRNDREEGQDR